MGRPGAAFRQRTSRLNSKRAFLRLYFFDANHEQTLRDRSTKMAGFVTAATDASWTTDTEGSDMEWQTTKVTVRRLSPAAEADQDLADFNFGDAPTEGAAAAAGQDDSQ